MPNSVADFSPQPATIPPKEEFIASCERFHSQIAGEAGELQGCLTLAQLIAENEKQRVEVSTLRKLIANCGRRGLAGGWYLNSPILKGESAELVQKIATEAHPEVFSSDAK